jgi:hypothetical protein
MRCERKFTYPTRKYQTKESAVAAERLHFIRSRYHQGLGPQKANGEGNEVEAEAKPKAKRPYVRRADKRASEAWGFCPCCGFNFRVGQIAYELGLKHASS